MKYGPAPRDPVGRFLDKFLIGDPEDCWPWLGYRQDSGHGKFRSNPQHNHVAAHRYAYELVRGPIPDGLCVLHRCDNPPCVNPDHLFLGTSADNRADCVAKGRQSRGAKHGNAKLTPEIVRAIRAAYRPRSFTSGPTAIARLLGLSRRAVEHVIYGQTWTHIE